jgi:hypothetical protein
MVRLPLVVVMQAAWSWIAFVDPELRQGQIRAASSPASSMFLSKAVPGGEEKISPGWPSGAF